MKIQLNIKIEKNDLKLAKLVAEKRGESIAVFVRRAIKAELARLGFLGEEEMRVLEVKS